MLLMFTVLIGMQSHAQNLELDRKKFLEEFSKNPAKASAAVPPKYNTKGQRISNQRSPFHQSVIESRQYVTLKDENRKQTCRASKPGQPCLSQAKTWAAPTYKNEVNEFLENSAVETNLERLETWQVQSVVTRMQPWSGDYWATARGGIAARYNDPEFPSYGDFGSIWKYMNAPQAGDRTQSNIMDVLAPSEKYDLLLGDANNTLTRAVLSESNEIFQRDGSIEGWWGICHGWAPAAFEMSRPRKTVEVQIPGAVTPLKFYPDDIKALASHLWAKTNVRQNFIGGRCNDKDPAVDPNGRVISSDCFEINPASWHLALLHLVGRDKRSFVMDATYDYEVWNQPIVGYGYIFFNPVTKEQFKDFKQAMISIKNFTSDPYSKYRNPQAAYVVGVAMTVRYVREVMAGNAETNDESSDALTDVAYYYDLEVDGTGNVIGGEWYQKSHPDFLWKPVTGALPLASEDASLRESWSGQGAPPASWTAPAQGASSRGQLLYNVVNELVRRAQ